MRNPILPSIDRPIPLPDCILMDGWWADLQAYAALEPAPPATDTVVSRDAAPRREASQGVATRRQ